MRIIGGALKGKLIQPPSGYKARPTTDFAREGLFNVLNNEYEFEDLKVLDLFGGTGAIACAGRSSTWFLPIRPMPWKDWKPCPTKSCHAISCIPAAILSWSTATSTISPPIPSLSRRRFTGGCIFRFLSRNN